MCKAESDTFASDEDLLSIPKRLIRHIPDPLRNPRLWGFLRGPIILSHISCVVF